jgi:hypothetical protein
MTYTIENAVRDLATLDFHNVFVDRSHSFWRSVQDWT